MMKVCPYMEYLNSIVLRYYFEGSTYLMRVGGKPCVCHYILELDNEIKI